MASEQLVESWSFRPALSDTWISEAFVRDTETLTRALQKSFSGTVDTISPFMDLPKPDPVTTPSASGSDPDTAPKRRFSVPVAGKLSKRKSRASKRSPTTYINADPANFRQMVQQVTGVRYGGSAAPMSQILKPEPQRIGGGRLPTLDTSFLLDHHHQLVAPTAVATHSGLVLPPQTVADSGGSGSGLDFDAFCSFPTLESWKVM